MFRLRTSWVVAAIAAGCLAATLGVAIGAEAARPQDVVVTRDDGRGPDSCRPAAIGERLVEFSTALRRADLSTLREVWNGPFAWFYVGLPKRRDIYAREPKKALAAVRRRDGLPLRLSEVEIDFDRSWGYPAVNMVYGGSWGPKRRHLEGKGFMLCERPAIRVWSTAVGRKHRPHRDGELCPAPPDGTDPPSLVVCTRRR